MVQQIETPNVTKNKHSLSIDIRLIVIVLLVVIAGMLAMWRPWVTSKETDRTISVSGEAKLTAEPDEYTFMPTYDFKDANKDTALANLTKKSDELVKKLKELGVADSKIKVNSDGYDYRNYFFDNSSKMFTYTLRPTVIVNSRDLAQKVEDYFVTTSPTGQISPQTGFSTAKQKELEGQARDTATKDARAKADQSAKNLGFKVNGVKSVNDGSNFGNIISPFTSLDSSTGSANVKPATLGIQPGENNLNYTVTVVYFIR